MGKYVKRIRRGPLSLGPTEERHAGVWNGYDIEGTDEDLSDLGLISVDALSDEEVLGRYGVRVFTVVDRANLKVRRFLGLSEPDRQ